MSTTEDRSSDASGTPGAGSVDMKLEVVTIPVSDVDRAKEFPATAGRAAALHRVRMSDCCEKFDSVFMWI